MGGGSATVLVTGGRDYSDVGAISSWLRMTLELIGPFRLVEGGARGADTLARIWAHGAGLEVVTVHADWANDGLSAGPRRNARMLREHKPDLVIAFPGGNGTADMVRRAKAAGIPVWRAA